jgi:hypothetical protein
MKVIWGLLGLCLLWSPGLAQSTFVLLVGVNNYRPYPETPAMPPLSYAESDARRMAQALRDPSKGRAGRVRLLVDSEASKTAIEAELRDLAKRLQATDTLIVYYSGHGMPNSQGQATLMPSDAKTNDEETWLPIETLQALVQRYSEGKGRLILILDACFSGQSQRGVRSFTMPGRKAPVAPQSPVLTGGNIVLASSSDTQPSWEDAELGGGVFTSYLLEAISGKGDENGDGYVTIGEAYRYASVQVEAFSQRKGNVQTPKLYGAEEYPLALNPTAVAKNRMANLKLAGTLGGEQFDALVTLIESTHLPEDLQRFLAGTLSDTQFGLLARSGAILGVLPDAKSDPRLIKIAMLRKAGKIRLEQFWAIAQMIQSGKAAPDLSDYLAGRLKEANFLQRLKSGAIRGVPR